MFKNWYSSYSNTPFISFNISIITCLCTVEFSQQVSQLNSLNGNDLTVLFNWCWSPLINKLFLIRSLKLFASEARTSNWSRFIKQLHSSRWSDTTACLNLFKMLSSQIRNTHMLFILSKKGMVCFTIISNFAVTTRVSVNNVRADLSLKGILKTEQQIKFAWWLEKNVQFIDRVN